MWKAWKTLSRYVKESPSEFPEGGYWKCEIFHVVQYIKLKRRLIP